MAKKLDIGGKVYPATANRKRQWRREVLLPLVAAQAQVRGKKLAEQTRLRRQEEQRQLELKVAAEREEAKRVEAEDRRRRNDKWAKSQGCKDYAQYLELGGVVIIW